MEDCSLSPGGAGVQRRDGFQLERIRTIDVLLPHVDRSLEDELLTLLLRRSADRNAPLDDQLCRRNESHEEGIPGSYCLLFHRVLTKKTAVHDGSEMFSGKKKSNWENSDREAGMHAAAYPYRFQTLSVSDRCWSELD